MFYIFLFTLFFFFFAYRIIPYVFSIALQSSNRQVCPVFLGGTVYSKVGALLCVIATACARTSLNQIGCISTLTVVDGHIEEKYGPQKAPSCCTANEDILRHGDSRACRWAINYSFVACICWKTWHLLGQSAAWRWAASTALSLYPHLHVLFIITMMHGANDWL